MFWQSELSEKITSYLNSFELKPSNIVCDGNIKFPRMHVENNKPLLLISDLNFEIFLILSYRDYLKIQDKIYTPDKYINSSTFYLGRFNHNLISKSPFYFYFCDISNNNNSKTGLVKQSNRYFKFFNKQFEILNLENNYITSDDFKFSELDNRKILYEKLSTYCAEENNIDISYYFLVNIDNAQPRIYLSKVYSYIGLGIPANVCTSLLYNPKLLDTYIKTFKSRNIFSSNNFINSN